MASTEDKRWLDAAARLASRGIPASRPNPAVGAFILCHGFVAGHGWTQPGGRPHAEAVALGQAGEAARGGTLYVSLEPCAHASERGPACADLIAASGLARVVIGCLDPDPRTAGKGIERIRSAGITVDLVDSLACPESLAGYLTLKREGRPHVTLKLALSEDGALARPPGESQWLTGEAARAHVHAWRARMHAIVVGAGTLVADQPRLDVRLPGLEDRSPDRWVLTHGTAPQGWQALASPQAIASMAGVQWLMVEGGAKAARAFLQAGLVDRLAIYRAPITIAGDVPRLPEFATGAIANAPQWHRTDTRLLGNDCLEVYHPGPCSPE